MKKRRIPRMRLYQQRLRGMILERRTVATNVGDGGYKKRMERSITSGSYVEVTSDVRNRSIPLRREVREPKKRSRRVHEKKCRVAGVLERSV
jgi:hypothetical protein